MASAPPRAWLDGSAAGGAGEDAFSARGAVLGRSMGRSVMSAGGFAGLLSEGDEDDSFADNDVDALPPVDDVPDVDLAAALEEAMRPKGRAGGADASRSRRQSVGSSAASFQLLGRLRALSGHDQQVELDAQYDDQDEPDEDAVEQLRGASATAELEALDAHAPKDFIDGTSPRAHEVSSPRARPRAPSVEEGEAPPTSVEPRSLPQEKEMALRIADKMMGTKAERAAAKTREQKEAPLRAWLLACSDAPSVWSCQTLGSCINGLPERASAPRTDVFGTNHLSASKPPTWYSQLFWCFLHPFNVLLSVLAIVAGSTGDFNSVTLIAAMISISVGIAFVQERRALISALALSKRITHKVRVRRPAGHDAAVDGNGPADMAAGSSRAMRTRLVDASAASGAPFRVEEIPSHELVPGDVVLLSAGSLVPADLRLLSCSQLLINQTILTGESLPAEKYAKRYKPHDDNESSGELAGHTDSHFLRRPNLAFMSTVVESGSGVGLVLSTGSNSYFGANAKELQQARPPSAFAKGVKQVSYVLMGFTAIMLPVVIIVNGLIKKNWKDAALFGAAVAVGITPVMLPMIVSGNLSLAAHNLAKRKCLVKRLEAVQNMGATTVLCTDKTGTLTNDHVSLNSAVTSDAKPAVRAMHVAYIIAAMQEGFRNVLDRAIVEYAETGPEQAAAQQAAQEAHEHRIAVGSLTRTASHRERSVLEESASESHSAAGTSLHEIRRRIVLPSSGGYRKVTELPFDFHRRRMSIVLDVFHDAPQDASPPRHDEAVVSLLPQDYSAAPGANSTRMLYCKGALAEMLRSCTHYRASETDMTVRPLDAAALEIIKGLFEQLSAQGLRILAVAEKRMEPADGSSGSNGEASKAGLPSIADESGMTLLGFLTFADTPKPSAAGAIADLLALGIVAKVLTGDNPLVARQVCGQLGIDSTHVLTGDDMSRLPEGDDDPSLLPLFQRTSIFSQLSPDDKARVVRVLRNGGATVSALGDGVNDALMLREADVGISVDTGADLAKEAADVILTEKDLQVLVTAVQLGRRTHGNSIKYIKMAASSNFGNCFSLLVAAAWLPFLPAGTLQLLAQGLLYDISQLAIPFDRMDKDWLRRPQQWSGDNLITFMVCIGPISSVFDVTTFAIAYYWYGLNDAHDDRKVKQFQTMWFMVGLVTQCLIVHCIRTERIPFLQSRAHPRLMLASGVIAAIGLALPWITPLANALEMETPPASFFVVVAATCVIYALLVLVVKKIYIRIFKQWL